MPGGATAREHGARRPVVPSHGVFSDSALTARARRGDRRALRSLYDRYAGEILDFATPLVGADEAPEVVVETFATAWDRLRVGVKAPRVEPWLLGIARASALSRAADPSRVRTAPPASGSEPVRRWLRTLTPRDHALVDLYVRRGLTIRELAAITGTAEQALRDHLHRLGADLERFTVSALVLGQSASCLDLAVLLGRIRGAPEGDLQKAVRLHARLCATCGFVAGRATASLAAVADLPAARWPDGGAAAAWSAVAAHSSARARATTRPGAPAPAHTPRRRRSVALAAAAGVCAVGAVLAVVVDPFGGGSGENRSAAPATPKLTPPQSVFEPPVASKPAQGGAAQPPAAQPPAAQPPAAQPPAAQPPAAQPPAAQPKVEQPKAAQPKAEQPRAEAPKPEQPAQAPERSTPPAAQGGAKPKGVAPEPRSRTLAWAPVGGAVGYELVLLRDGREVYKVRTDGARTVLPTEWTYKSRRVALQEGYYRWIVWPILVGQRKAERAVVVSNLHID